MASPLFALFRKELRVIFRDPTVLVGTILIPVLLFPLMGSAISVSEEATLEQLAQVEIAFLSFDVTVQNESYSFAFYSALIAANLTVVNATAGNDADGVAWTLSHGVDTLVVVDANFTQVIKAGRAGSLRIFQVLKNFGPAELGGEQSVRAALAGFNAGIAADRAAGAFPNSTAAEILFPARATSASVIRGEVRDVPPETVVNTVLGGSIMLPIVISIMILVSAQLAATSVAAEKEQKTLEVLLTLPTRREYILLGKLAGVFVVALIGTLSVFIGFSSYAGSITASLPTADPASSGLVPDMEGYALLVVTLLLSFVSALCLAVLIASYAKDIYGAQSLMSVVYLPVFLPSILMSFSPVEILPTGFQALIYGIPFSYPSLAGKALYTHDYGALYLGALYQLAFMVVVLYLAARLFSTEKVLTARLSLRRRKRNRAPGDE